MLEHIPVFMWKDQDHINPNKEYIYISIFDLKT